MMVDRKYSRRPGRMYKNTNTDITVTSKYFNINQREIPFKPDEIVTESIKNQKWIPPRSPYSLIQEDLFADPWQLLVATIFLTKTSAERSIPQIHKFLARFPTPESLLNAHQEEIIIFLSPLGLENLRSHNLIRFTQEYLGNDWKYPVELHGIGKYGNDSYRIFCCGEWKETIPDDIPLNLYRNWLIDNADKLGL